MEINCLLRLSYTKWPLGSAGSILCFGRNPLELFPNVENSGMTRSRASRPSRIGRLFCGVEHTGGVALGLEGTTTRKGDFPFPNLPEFLPRVAGAGRVKW